MSSTIGLCIVICFIVSIIYEADSLISYPPSNTAAEINGEAIFNCSTNSASPPFAWTLSRDGTTSGEIRIASNCVVSIGLQTHYRIEQPGGQATCNLVIFNITMEQAGAYRCVETDIYGALLTVIDPAVNMTYNNTQGVMEGENVVITCTLNYNGSVLPAPTLAPHFYWTNYAGNNVSSFYDSTPVNSQVISQLSVKANRTDITPYTCHVYLELNSTTLTGYASNKPPVDSSASSSTMPVLYGPSRPEITLNGSVDISLNGVPCAISILHCSSSGYPLPNYRWYDSADDMNTTLSTNETLTLGEINRTYNCEANNTIRTMSRTYSVKQSDCASTVKCCVYPHNETTSITVESCPDNKTQCDCSQGSSGIQLFCNATTFPNASYMWSGPDIEPTYSQSCYNQVFMNGKYRCTAYFNRTLSNYTGDVNLPNGTKEAHVTECAALTSTTGPTTTTTTTVSSSKKTENPSLGGGKGSKAGEDAGIAIACIIGVNVLTTFFFIGYYTFNGNSTGTTGIGGDTKPGRNKIRLNKRFPWLQKMLPCLNDTKGTAGTNFPWVLLFILLGTFTGIVTVPVWIGLAIKSEANDETSALKKRDDTENENTENGRRSPSYPPSPTGKRTKAQPRQDPYQNPAGNIELERYPHSRNHHLTDSPTSNASMRGKPPPPPKNKPTLNSPNRSIEYTDNGSATLNNPEPTTYAELPINFGNAGTTPSPVQLLVPDDPSDNYAVLNKT